MNRHHSIVVSIAFMAIMLGAFVMDQFYEHSNLYTLGLSVVPVVMIFIVITVLNDSDIFSPLYLVLYLLLISIFLKTIYLLYMDSALSQRVSLDGRRLDILIPGLVGVSIAIAFFLLGYISIIRERTLKKIHWNKFVHANNFGSKHNYNSSSYAIFLLLCAVVFTISFALFSIELNIFDDLKRGIFSSKRALDSSTDSVRGGTSSLGYLRWGAATLPQVVVLATVAQRTIYGVSFRSSTYLLLIYLGVGSLLVPLLTSARLELIYFFLMLGMISHYYKKQYKIEKVVILAVLLVSITGLLGEARVAGKYVNNDYAWSISNALDKIMGGAYFADIAKTSVIIDSVPDSVDYLYGKSFTLFLVAPIPRAFWPNKPSVRISAFVGEGIYNRHDKSGIPPGFIAEAYMNFGCIGIVVLLFVLGMACGLIYRRFIVRSDSMLSALWYTFAIVILTFTLLSGDFTVAVSQAVRYGVTLALVRKYLIRKTYYKKRKRTIQLGLDIEL